MLGSLILADVDARRLAKIELVVSCFLHEVEEGVFEDELHKVHKWFLHVHAFAEQFFGIDT